MRPVDRNLAPSETQYSFRCKNSLSAEFRPKEAVKMSNGVAYEDEHLTVARLSFNSHKGVAEIVVREKHSDVGFYYITVTFESNNSTRIDYDGGNPNRVFVHTVQTMERNDRMREIKVVRVRD